MSPTVSQLLACVFFVVVLLLSHAEGMAPAAGEKPPSSFAFIKRLQGCRKGDKVKGLYQLKNYLRKFGYIDDLPGHADEDDDFDGALESAIRTYQTNYSLNSTGVLDAETVSQMMTPRCGVPDIVKGKSWTHPHIHHRRRLGSLHVVSHFSLFPGNPKWPSDQSDLTYGFAQNVPSEFFSPVAMAFATWAAQTHFTFTRAEYNVANLKISMAVGDHGDGSPFDGPGGVQAHATVPTAGIAHFDADEKWSSNPSTDALDIQTVSLHEIGHLLGLDHSSVPGSSMWPYTGLGERRRALSDDDVQGIRTLYPYGRSCKSP